MPSVKFNKYHGAGDDLIVIDNRDGKYDDFLEDKDRKAKMCHRHFGIGANGIIEIKSHQKYLLEMRFHAGSGNLSLMCGNGSRMLITHATKNGFLPENEKDVRFFVHGDVEHVGHYDPEDDRAYVSMRDIPTVLKLSDTEYFAHSGQPHLVVFTSTALDDLEIIKEGRKFSESRKEHGSDEVPVIVNFVREGEDGHLLARCFDPNIDDELWSCGTATTVVAVCHAFKTAQNGVKIEDGQKVIQWRGGKLTVDYHREEGSFTNLKLGGPICHVYTGIYSTD